MSLSALFPFLDSRAGRATRSALILAAFLVSTWLLALVFDATYPIQSWLTWRYLKIWGWVALFALASLSVGNSLVHTLSTPGERADGRFTLAFATGVFVFFLAVFAAGVAGQLNTPTFFLIPTLLFAVGARRLCHDAWTWYLGRRERQTRFALTLTDGILLALGVVGVVVVFLPTLVPENIAYDARWYHLPLAEQYAIQGAIRRFPEGWVAGTIPHLASILYTWAFLAPGAELFDKVVLAAQLEFAVFLFTLPGIPLLVRCVAPNLRSRMAWVALFAFPSIFIYDSSLSVAADHIAALFSIPVFVTMLRALRSLRPAACALFAIQLSGLVMTKYTAAMCVVLPLLLVLGRAGQLAWRRLRGRLHGHDWLIGPLTALVVGLAVTAPHWLKNWVWYGDPIYPMLHAHLRLRPWIPDGAFLYEVFTKGSHAAQGSWGDKLSGAAIALYDHSYWLYTWEQFHGWFPVFGSLFTFSVLALPLLRAPRSLWLLVLATHVGIAAWYVFFHEDRYLQSLLPWMAAASAGLLGLAFQAGIFARIGAMLLLLLQLVGGTEAIFWPTHQIAGRSGIGLANDFFAQTLRGDYSSRTRPFQEMQEIGRDLAPGSKILVHNEHLRLGLGVASATDAYRIQYGLSYGYLGTSAGVHRKLREYGITHVWWSQGQTYGVSSVAAELLFHAYAQHLVNSKTVGGKLLAELPKTEPKAEGSQVFYFDCGHSYASGLYDIGDLNVSPLTLPDREPPTLPGPRTALQEDNQAALIEAASFAVIQTTCPGAPALPEFRSIARWNSAELMLRK